MKVHRDVTVVTDMWYHVEYDPDVLEGYRLDCDSLGCCRLCVRHTIADLDLGLGSAESNNAGR